MTSQKQSRHKELSAYLHLKTNENNLKVLTFFSKFPVVSSVLFPRTA